MAPTRDFAIRITTPYEIFVRQIENEQAKMYPNSNVGFQQLASSQQCIQLWQNLTVEQRQPFENMAVQENEQRHRWEMNQPVPVPTVAVAAQEKKKKTRKKKDPNAPKHPVNAYFLFTKDERPKVRGQYPDLKIAEVAKELGQRWKTLAPGLKKQYEDMAAINKERYVKEKSAYEQRLAAEAEGSVSQHQF